MWTATSVWATLGILGALLQLFLSVMAGYQLGRHQGVDENAASDRLANTFTAGFFAIVALVVVVIAIVV